MREELRMLSNECDLPTHFAAVDNRLLVLEKADPTRIDWIIAQSQSQGTELKPGSEELALSAVGVCFLTDNDGFRSLGPSARNIGVGRFQNFSHLDLILGYIDGARS
jgi:hypothetical protein